MLHQLNLDNIWFEQIVLGNKTVEGRLAKDKFREMNTGDVIKFKNRTGNEINVKISRLTHYNSFEEYLNTEGLTKTLPGYSFDEGINIYRKYYSYTDENTYGVLAIEFVHL